jgi:hypothetical protein
MTLSVKPEELAANKKHVSCVQGSQISAKVLMWEGREILTGLWLAHSQHDILLQNAQLACSMLERQCRKAEANAESILQKVCSVLSMQILSSTCPQSAVTRPCVLQLKALASEHKTTERSLAQAWFGKSQLQV